MARGALIAPLVSIALAGCAGRSVLEDPPDGGPEFDASGVDAALPTAPRSDQLDLLLVVDNSRGLDVAHALFADTVPYLLDRLSRPACVNGLGNIVASTPSPTDKCPSGVRDFAPLRDIHVAVISTSLGGHGADVCSPANGSFTPTQNDAAHLLTRAEAGGTVPTYQDKGFLAWDPGQLSIPPGDADPTAVSAKLADLVRGSGTTGCGFEAQLESIYRFLVEPNPYASIEIEGTSAVLKGTDDIILKQRADFLRPTSALAVVLLTDENDCSTREGGQFYFSNQGLTPGAATLFHLPRARSECASNPADPCCASCGQADPPGCPPSAADPVCQLPPMNDVEDPINLRCFDQKRRFGIDFLNPTDRYVRGFTEPFVADRDGNVVENPIFAGGRDASLVFFEGIVGVPWVDIAADPKALVSGFLPTIQIDWGLLLGYPDEGLLPFDPLMIESIEPRSGQNPVTGAPLAPPDAPPMANPLNGHERLLPAKDDLQLACIYARPSPKQCSGVPDDCECVGDKISTNPLCQAQDGTYSSLQRYARALPSTRVLTTLRDLGPQAAVASVCAPVVTDPSQATFGYRPAVDALLRTIRRGLRQPEPPTNNTD